MVASAAGGAHAPYRAAASAAGEGVRDASDGWRPRGRGVGSGWCDPALWDPRGRRGGETRLQVHLRWMPAPAAPGTPSSLTLRGSRLRHDLDLNQVGMIKIGSPAPRTCSCSSPVPRRERPTSCRSRSRWSNGCPTGRSGRSNGARTCSRTSRCCDRAKQRPGDAAGTLPLLPRLPRRNRGEQAAHRASSPEAALGFAPRMGHERRRRRPAHGDRKRERPRRQGGARRALAGRLGRDRLRDLGLRRHARRRRPVRARLRRRRQRPDADQQGNRPKPSSRNSRKTTPWLAFGGIGSPFLGLFSSLGAMATSAGPEEASLAESFALLPANLKPQQRRRRS